MLEEVSMKRTVILLLASLAVFAIAVSAAGAASSPTVSTGVASNIKNTRADLNGSVNPNGAETHYWFVYGPTTLYGGTTSRHSAGSGTRPISVRLPVGALLPGTVYHYRLVAQNAFGTTIGGDRTLRTTGHPLPGVFTGGVTNVSAFGATVNGTILTNGGTTSWFFQYSSGAPFVSTQPGTAVGSSSATSVSQNLGGLAPGSTYQYRLVGTRGSSTFYGPFEVFSTFPLARPYPPRFTASTTPSRDRSKPFIFTTTGSLIPSSQFVSSAQCTGTVSIRYFIGNRQVTLSNTSLQSNCTFASQVVFNHTFAFKIGGKRPATEQLRVETRFGGNGYIAPTAKARVGHVTLG
jgi:phosphodiesterase/alkaline phosphatase D-like protein